MARVLVTGASGRLGRRLMPRLVAAGYDVRAVSRVARPTTEGVSWVVGDLRAGTGVVDAVGDTDVVLHCATAQRGDEDAARHLLAACSGGQHVVYISIVGVDRVQFGYYRTKLAVEQLIAGSGLGFTILRTTQFHDLLIGVVAAQRRLPVVFVPASTSFQPIDAGEVADRLVAAASSPPAGRLSDVGGPQVRPADDLARACLAAAGRRRRVVAVRVPGNAGRALRDGALVCPANPAGGIGFEDYLASS